MAFPIKTALASVALATIIASAAQAADVPKLDVARMCRESAAADPAINFDAQRCLNSENQARDQLAQQWSSFPAADRQQCTLTATMGGTASYVELITCLEMKRDVAKLPADRGLNVRPAGLPRK